MLTVGLICGTIYGAEKSKGKGVVHVNLKIHSFESFGTVDGPGIRFVVFVKGCPLRCRYCHNPDTWDISKGDTYEVSDIAARVLKYKSYFENGGGVTVSGGEPLLQIEAVTELFTTLKGKGIHTCLDTSGGVYTEANADKYDALLNVTDLVLLDIKEIDDEKHKALTGISNKNTLSFARLLSDRKIPMWVRHVLVPGVTEFDEDLRKLKAFLDTLNNVEKVEVLPYHSMGRVKYENLGLPYTLDGVEAPTKERVLNAKKILGIIKE